MRTTPAEPDWTLSEFQDEDFLLEEPFDLAAEPASAGRAHHFEAEFAFDDAPQDPLAIDGPAGLPPFEDEADAPLGGAPPAPMVGAFQSGAGEFEQPVPSIRIRAFCDRVATEEAIGRAAKDRRLSRADVAAAAGGIEAAIARLAAEPSPDLLILDTAAGAAELIGHLDRLAEVVEPGCKVMVIGAANDIALYRELMRRGVSEYLVAPVEPMPLIRSIAALYVDPDKPFAGRVAAVIGARGGVGASTLAHNLAWCIASTLQVNATLVDLDLPFGTAALDFNDEPSQSILDALAAPERVDEVFLDRVATRPVERLQVFNAPAKLDRLMEMDPAAVQQVLDRVRRTGPHIILDLPHTWSSWIRETLIGADDIVIVAAPDLASLRNTKHIVDALAKSRPHDAPPKLILNTVGMPKRPEIPAKDFGEHVGFAPTAEIPFDAAAFGAAANNGQMLMEAAPNAKAAQAVAALAGVLTGRTPPAPKRGALLGKLPLLKR